MTNINIQDNICWVCGNTNNLTTHHVLPKHLKPIKNITIPVCEKCHEEINKVDLKGMYSFIFKILNQVEKSKKDLRIIKQSLDHYIEIELQENKK